MTIAIIFYKHEIIKSSTIPYQLLSNLNPNQRAKLNRFYQLRSISIPRAFDPSLQSMVNKCQVSFKPGTLDPETTQYMEVRPWWMMTGQLSSHPYHWWRASQSRTASWLGQPSTTTPALEGLVVTPAQINSSASNRRRHQRPGSWSTHSEPSGSAQAGLNSATHSWQVDPSKCVHR